MVSSKTSRLDARLSEESLELIRRAAEIEGRTVSDFVVGSARAAAARVIEDNHIIRLSVEDSVAFLEALAAPEEPMPPLRRAGRAYRSLISSSE